ncbi:hypothetical protein Poli38472_008292 [Pythium oligandrum]|uniref:Uncharacterized protein n=1 Tax=Pythium oligandrum TaxID=41045 RepID=A0A8K1CLV1_PYTOL|nr:hypothetical protein Poli38472_008292 [Pythium oligandrum]|eukprot:TMW65650.1 hypothetical protein Poli38472_008292 [Pythium oligandrum]
MAQSQSDPKAQSTDRSQRKMSVTVRFDSTPPAPQPSSSIVSDDEMVESLDAYIHDSDTIVRHTIRRYVTFMRQCQEGKVRKEWKRLKTPKDMYLYSEQIATSSVDEVIAGKATMMSDRAYHASIPHGMSTFVSAFGGGEITGSLDDVMAGLYADNVDDHFRNCSVQFGNISDCGIAHTFQQADESDPYRYLGVKWLEAATSDDSESFDEMYWMERMGIHNSVTGMKFGYHLMKTVDFADEDLSQIDNAMIRSIHLSVCYLYHQVDEKTVHVFVRGIIEIPHEASAVRADVIKQATSYLLAPTRARECVRMKEITALINDSKIDRENMMMCRCSKVLKGLPRMDLCSTCRNAMRQCKIVSIQDMTGKPVEGRNRSSSASTTSVSSEVSRRSSLFLESRNGSVRRDGSTSTSDHDVDDSADSIDDDAHSMRMFVPLHKSRSDTKYRKSMREQDNVLIKMLSQYEERRRFFAADELPPTS